MAISVLLLFCISFLSNSQPDSDLDFDIEDLNFDFFSEEVEITDEIPDKYEAFASFTDLVKYYGFNVETHKVMTADGYILTHYRILRQEGADKSVVFLQHGLLDLSDNWITNSPSVAFKLAKSGYDVWCGNSRGTFHSKAHQTLDPEKDKAKYWAFTWQHMADYDIPASINYVLSVTKQAKLSYIGHSQGTIQMFARLADHPEFINKLHIFIALAPVGTVKHVDIDFKALIQYSHIFKVMLNFRSFDFLQHSDELSRVLYSQSKKHPKLISTAVSKFADKNIDVDNTDRFPVIFAHEPGGTSTMNMEHWRQMANYNKDKVQRYDYGSRRKNIEAYGQASPPEFDFSKIRGPIALFYGGKDRLVSLTDFKWLESILSKTNVEKFFYPEFGHGTFLWAKDLSYVDDDVIPLIEKYSNRKNNNEL